MTELQVTREIMCLFLSSGLNHTSIYSKRRVEIYRLKTDNIMILYYLGSNYVQLGASLGLSHGPTFSLQIANLVADLGKLSWRSD